VLPSIKEYVKRKNALPKRLTFSLAALIAFYRATEMRDGTLIGHRGSEEYKIADDAPALAAFQKAWTEYDKSKDLKALVTTLLGANGPWAEDLNAIPGFTAGVTSALQDILTHGALAAMKTANA